MTMNSKLRCVRLAMLNADTSTPNVYANLGTFGDILYRVLAEAAARLDEDLTITYSVFDVVQGEYPEFLCEFDAVILTASAASSYHLEPWIQTLQNYILRLYRDCPNIRIFGSCFGHHLICQALLKDHGLRVERSPRGWEIGIHRILLTDDFREALETSIKRNTTSALVQQVGRLPSPEDDDDTASCGARFSDGPTVLLVPQTVRLQFVHEDHVIMPSTRNSLPTPWILLGSTEHCAVQGVHLPGKVLTLQGHFEFDKFESLETQRIFGANDSSVAEMNERNGCGSNMTDDMDDGYLVAEMVVHFLVDAGLSGGNSSNRPQEGYLPPTPRVSVEIS